MVRTVLAALLAFLVLPCGAAPTPITIVVPGPGAASYLPIELIPKIGADREEGAEVKVSFASGGVTAMDELLGRNADFAVLALPTAMFTRLRDPRPVAVAAVNDLPLYVLLARQGLKGQVRSVADLRGRTVAVHGNSLNAKTNSHIVLDLMLGQAGIGEDMVRVVPVSQRWKSEASILEAGDADAIMGDEPHASRMIAAGTAYSLLHLGNPAEAAKVPGGAFLRGALVTTTELMQSNPQKIETMVRILRRTLAWMARATPEEIVGKADIRDPEERKHFIEVLKKYPRQYSTDARFSSRQLKETEIFFRASQWSNPAAQSFRVESMVNDRWAGRKP